MRMASKVKRLVEKMSSSKEPPPEILDLRLTPRDYQIELLEKAIRHNSIVLLPTGSGKTFIAAKLIEALSAETMDSWGNLAKRSFFLVCTVPLALQQADQLTKRTSLKVCACYGEKSDSWTSAQWKKELMENQIFVMTAETFSIILYHGYFPLERVNVIVFDECHRTVGSHPYSQIMDIYDQTKKKGGSLPRILGLTPSLINKDIELNGTRLKEAIRELERKMDSRVVTATRLLSVHRTKPLRFTFTCHKRTEDRFKGSAQFRNFLSQIEQENFDNYQPTIKFINERMERASNVYDQLGPWCCFLTVDRLLAKFERYLESKIACADEEKRLIIFGRTNLRAARELLKKSMKGMDEDFFDVMEYLLPSRVSQVLLVLEECRRGFGVEEFSGLVFVEQRYIAMALKESIETIIDRFKYPGLNDIRVEYVVGSSGRHVSDEQLGVSPFLRLSQVISDFRQKTFNLLIATNVLEEGVDVPHCNCVIHFDAPKNFTSYVQAQGRARSEQSRYYVLIDEENADKFSRKRDLYDKNEKEIYNPANYTVSKPERELFDLSMADTLQPPFFPPIPDGVDVPGRPQLRMLNAISVVNRYCSNLPSDIFTRLTTKYRISEIPAASGQATSMFQGSLTLPLNSPLKHVIKGLPMPNRKLARMSTAFNVAKTLFEQGELDYQLLPVRGVSLNSYLLDDPKVESDERVILESEGRCGTKRRRCRYPRKIADALGGTRPMSSQPNYLHLIDFHPKIQEDIQPRPLGILSSKPIPKLPQFPVYMGSGEHGYDVKIRRIEILNEFDNEQLQRLSEFHKYLFSNVMKFSNRSGLEFDWEAADCGYLLVPLKKESLDTFKIDFKYIQLVFDESSRQQNIPKESDRLLFQFDRERFSDAVIIPWHGGETAGQELLFLRKIRDDLNPQSPMCPTAKSKKTTFREHYYEKFGLKIYGYNIPLLEASGRGFNPVIPNYHQLKDWKRRRLNPNEDEPDISSPGKGLISDTDNRPVFVPELVHVHPIPASLWKRLMLMPYILHRLNALLLAIEWHRKVESEVFNRPHISIDHEIPITYDLDDSDILQRQNAETVDREESILKDDQESDDDDSGFESEDQPPIDFRSRDQSVSIPDDSDEEYSSDSEPTKNLKLTDSVFDHFKPIKPPSITTDFDMDRFLDHPHGPHLGLIMAAMTLQSADDGSNLERLETIGDSFLKLAVSEYLYNVFDNFHEGKLTFLKSQLISNRNLFKLGTRHRLPDFMLAEKFQAMVNWTPPGYRWEKNDRYLVTHQSISDKSVADCVEATIGVYVMTYGRKKALEYLKWLGIGVKPKEGDENIDLWAKPTRNPLLNFSEEDPMDDLRILWQKSGLRDFEYKLGYEFKNKAYLLQAFTHPSCYMNQVTDCYQPLEFLGDAVLDYLITNVLFKDDRQFDPGLLTDLRSALVNNTMFAALAVKNKFNQHLLEYCPLLEKLITSFAEIQELRDDECNFNDLLTEKEGDLSEAEVPKALGDIFESVAGAIYLDSGSSLDVVWSIYYPMLKDQIEKCCAKPPKSPIRELHEELPNQISFKKLGDATDHRGPVRMEVRLPGVQKSFIGVGRNGRAAKNTAAKRALKYLNAQKRRVIDINGN